MYPGHCEFLQFHNKGHDLPQGILPMIFASTQAMGKDKKTAGAEKFRGRN
jgi:hypothetical protein